jgi:DNA-binding NarL/FixJ family response regulator
MRPVSVVVWDDQRMFAAALASSLENATHRVLGVVERVEDLPDELGSLHPDVCVMDVLARGHVRTELIDAIKARSPGIRVLVLTSTDDVELWQAYDAGLVDAVVSKSHGLETFRTAIDRVALGERFAVASARPPVPIRTIPVSLTQRERDILRMLARGATTCQIMEAFAISRNTVRTHVQHLLDKLHAHTRAQAVQIAMTTHLLIDLDLVLS